MCGHQQKIRGDIKSQKTQSEESKPMPDQTQIWERFSNAQIGNFKITVIKMLWALIGRVNNVQS